MGISFHRSGAVQPGVGSAPWVASRVGVLVSLVVFDLDWRSNGGEERLRVDDRIGVGLSPDTNIVIATGASGPVPPTPAPAPGRGAPRRTSEAPLVVDGEGRVYGATTNAARPDDVDNALLLTIDTRNAPTGPAHTIVYERLGSGDRQVILDGVGAPLPADDWKCQ